MQPITDSVDLGYVLSHIPQADFKMDKFQDRLRLQKTIYCMQMFGVYLGYDFSWNIRGPYCTKLAKSGRMLSMFHEKIPKEAKVNFAFEKDRKSFERAKKFLNKIDKMLPKTDLDFTDKVEIVASIHNLLINENMKKEDIIEKVSSKQSKFDEKYCLKLWEIMEDENLIDCDMLKETPPSGSLHLFPTNDDKIISDYVSKKIPRIQNNLFENKNYDDLAMIDIITDASKCKEFAINHKLLSELQIHKISKLESHISKEKLLSSLMFNE